VLSTTCPQALQKRVVRKPEHEHRHLIIAFEDLLRPFKRDLIRERVKSGLGRVQAAIAKDGHFITKGGKRRAQLGRRKGYRPSEKHAEKVLKLKKDGLSYRLIGRNLGLSKNTVMQIVQRAASQAVDPPPAGVRIINISRVGIRNDQTLPRM
jgi:DNA invertase Pin-like site-specific DNA recombinase